MPSIPFDVYRKKVVGCWRGKSVGGTLGGPWEGKPGPLDLTYYDPVPTEMLPNDDLDLQVVWLEQLRRVGLPVNRLTLADAWEHHIKLWPGEYGVACRNLYAGLKPPLTGAFDNGFTCGMGAAIRTELWACLAPGDPELAARFAYEDACVDHTDEGIHAATYLAALESLAFIESDRDKLITSALSMIPSTSRVRNSIQDCRAWYNDTADWAGVRQALVDRYARQDWTDVAINLAFTMFGWISADTFGDRLCNAVNCGSDADCTGATLGSILGIIDPECIGVEWMDPIGDDLVLSPGMCGMHHVRNLEEFTDQVTELAMQVQGYYKPKGTIEKAPKGLGENLPAPRVANPKSFDLSTKEQGRLSQLATTPLTVGLIYPESLAISPGQPAPFDVTLKNPTDRELTVSGRLTLPPGLSLDRPTFSLTLAPQAEKNHRFNVVLSTNGHRPYRHDLDITLSVDGLTWTLTAGLQTTRPWRFVKLPARYQDAPPAALHHNREPAIPEHAETREIMGTFLPLEAGPQLFAIDIKIPYTLTTTVTAQCLRSVRVWIDGNMELAHDTGRLWPSIHGHAETAARVKLKCGWHRFVITVGDGSSDEPLCFALGNGETWQWFGDIEFRPTALPIAAGRPKAKSLAITSAG